MGDVVVMLEDFGQKMRISQADDQASFSAEMLNQLDEQHGSWWPGGFTLHDDFGGVFHYKINYPKSTRYLIIADKVANPDPSE